MMAKNKMKTRKTAAKRVKITSKKKLVKKSIMSSHLKRKWNTDKRLRKRKDRLITAKGYKASFKKLLPGKA